MVAFFFELLILFEVLLDFRLVFLQVGPDATLALILGGVALVSMLIVVMVVEDLLEEGLFAFGRLLSVYHKITSQGLRMDDYE